MKRKQVYWLFGMLHYDKSKWDAMVNKYAVFATDPAQFRQDMYHNMHVGYYPR